MHAPETTPVALFRIWDPRDKGAAALVAVAAWCFDLVLTIAIIAKVPYTEIDWVAYMQQVEAFLGGERDYTKIVGQTGPVVYPAGHLYIYTGTQGCPVTVVFGCLNPPSSPLLQRCTI